jgi:N-acyl-D-aspartate/D-glutamate deacylase
LLGSARAESNNAAWICACGDLKDDAATWPVADAAGSVATYPSRAIDTPRRIDYNGAKRLSPHAKTDELIALAEVAAKYKGIYISHMRNEGNHEIEAIDELITIAPRRIFQPRFTTSKSRAGRTGTVCPR